MKESHSRTNASRAGATPIALRYFRLWHDRTDNQEVRIEIVPLIDVVFCILIFFILAAVSFSRQQAIGLDLPKASTGKPQMREMLVVSLDDLGQVYVEQQLVTSNQLFQALKNYHQYNPNGLMVLHASRNASYNEVVRVLDMLREVGGNRVALATLPGESEALEAIQGNLTPNFNNNLPSGTNLPGGSPYSLPQNLPPSMPNSRLGNSQSNPYAPSVPSLPSPPNTTPGRSN